MKIPSLKHCLLIYAQKLKFATMSRVRRTSHLTQSDLPSIVPAAAWRFLGVDSQLLDVGKVIDIHRTIIATFLSKYFGKRC